MFTSDDGTGVALIGITGTAGRDVTTSDTASAVGSGDLPVLATPIMVALMEAAACDALIGRLQPGFTSVGSRIDVRHLAPSIVGARVTAAAEIIDVRGSKVTFAVSAQDSSGGHAVEVGAGTHVRVIVERERFLAGLDS